MPDPLIFLTGFPGFIATRLVRRLLADDPRARVAALVEARMAGRARALAADLDPERVEILTGDIADRRLGLEPETYARLVGEMTQAFHLAAIYDLAVPLEVAQRVNVEGTGNVLELCARAERLQRHNYVSTAYVAGDRHGVVYEHELVLGQGFKNHYESTKFQAELWVRQRGDDVPTTIHRPAIVVGDSRTGETQKFDGPYYLLRLIALAGRRRLPLPQAGRGSSPFNVVPVDFVVDAMATAAGDPAAVGQTLHLVDPEPVSAAELLDLLARAYGEAPRRVRVPSPLMAEPLRVPALRQALAGTPRESIVYLNHEVRFDTRRAGDVLAPHGLRCPRFPEYVEALVRFFRQHEEDGALAPAA